MLDEAGYYGALVSDHLIYPKELKSPYPYSPHPDGRPIWEPETSWPDSWVLIGAMAAVTKQLHFNNSIYIAGARPLLQVAKQVATAAVLSGDRVALGVGAGWMREEFELMGQSFDNRGPRLNEMMQALRELWKGGWVEWHGEYYEIPPLMMEPHPAEPVPIFCGGHSNAALKRAARYGDGWIGNAYPWDEAAEHVGRLKGYLKEFGRENDPFEIVVGFYNPPTVDLYKRTNAASPGVHPACERLSGRVTSGQLRLSSLPESSGLASDRTAPAHSSGVTFSGWWQAARCPSGYCASGGSTSRQMSVA
jgi:probable F420-dependent oxidoreductase